MKISGSMSGVKPTTKRPTFGASRGELDRLQASHEEKLVTHDGWIFCKCDEAARIRELVGGLTKPVRAPFDVRTSGYALCRLIEKIPASPEQTAAIIAAVEFTESAAAAAKLAEELAEATKAFHMAQHDRRQSWQACTHKPCSLARALRELGQ